MACWKILILLSCTLMCSKNFMSAQSTPMKAESYANGTDSLPRNSMAEHVRKYMMQFAAKTYNRMLLEPTKTVLLHGSLQMFFKPPQIARKEKIIRDYLLLYIPLGENVPRSTCVVNVRDFFSGEVVARHVLSHRQKNWYRVPLHRWLQRWLTSKSGDQALEIRVEQNGKGCNIFERFYSDKESHGLKIEPYLFLYYKNEEASDFKDNEIRKVLFHEESVGRISPEFPGNLGRMKRNSGKSSCGYKIQHYRLSMNSSYGSLVSSGKYTSKVCTGVCSSSGVSSTLSTCDQGTQDCCVPSNTSSFAVLYVHSRTNASVVKIFRDLIVNDCACASSLKSKT